MYQCWAECWHHLVCDHCSVKYERVTYCQQPPAHADLSPILQTSGVETKIHNYKTSPQQNIEHTWHNHQMRNDKFTEKHWLQMYVLSLSSFSYPSSESMNAKLQFQWKTRVSSWINSAAWIRNLPQICLRFRLVNMSLLRVSLVSLFVVGVVVGQFLDNPIDIRESNSCIAQDGVCLLQDRVGIKITFLIFPVSF